MYSQIKQRSNCPALLFYKGYQVSLRRFGQENSRTGEISAAHFIEYSMLVCERHLETAPV